MIVRPATLPDLIWIRMLYAQLLEEVRPLYPSYDATDLESFTSSVAARLGADPHLVCWVAEDGPVIGGFVIGEILHRLIGHPRIFATAHWLYIVPPWRNQGVGRALSSVAIEDFIARGAQAIELAAVPGDSQWAHRGWTPVATTYSLPPDAARATVIPHGPANGTGQHVDEVSSP